jgi:hypothetical protein
MKTLTDGDTLSRNSYTAFVLCRRRSIPNPLGACPIAHNLWGIASFCGYTPVAEECKKQIPAAGADVR